MSSIQDGQTWKFKDCQLIEGNFVQSFFEGQEYFEFKLRAKNFTKEDAEKLALWMAENHYDYLVNISQNFEKSTTKIDFHKVEK